MVHQRRDYYVVLGVKPDADPDQLRTAYREAAKQNHPDRFTSYIQRLRATARMQEINEAYSVLRDPERRRAYDAARPGRAAAPDRPPAKPTSRAPRPAPPGPQPGRRVAWDQVLVIGGWLVGSAVFAYFMSGGKAQASAYRYVLLVLISLFFSPFIILTIFIMAAIPVMLAAMAFRDSYASKQWQLRSGAAHVWRDMLVRSALLAVVVFALGWLVHAEFDAELPYIVLLGWGGGIAGELGAMILWIFRRRKVVAETIALLQT